MKWVFATGKKLLVINMFFVITVLSMCLHEFLLVSYHIICVWNINNWCFISALAKFCEAILDYLANIEKAPDPDVKKAVFQTEIAHAFDVLLNVWIHSKEPKVHVQINYCSSQPLSRDFVSTFLPLIWGSALLAGAISVSRNPVIGRKILVH